MRLSDSYKQHGEACHLELVAKVYNINKGRNAEMARRSKALGDYSKFIAEVKGNLKKGMRLGMAIKAAIKTCMGKKILLDFLKEHSSEVINMLITAKWDMRKAKSVWRKEAKEEGMREGMREGLRKGMREVFALLEKGMSISEAKKELGLANVHHR